MEQNQVPNNTGYLDVLNYIATGLSMASCFWMLWFFLSTKPKSIALKLVMAITLSDLLYSISNLLAAFHNDEANSEAYCQFEGFIREFGVTSSIYFVTSTAILCYKDSQFGCSFNQDKFFKLSILGGLALCLGFSLPPLFLENMRYQEAQQMFCWIVYTPDQSDQNKRLLIVSLFQGIPLALGLIVSFVGYMKAIRNYENELNLVLNFGTIDVKKLLWYPISLFLIMLPSLTDNIVGIYHPIGNDVFKGAHLLLTHSSGFFNALVYGIQMRNAINRTYQKKPKSIHHLEMCDDLKSTHSISQELFMASTIDYRY